jgi:hypothetical protein
MTILILILLVGLTACAEPFVPEERFTSAANEAVEARRQAIVDELAGPGAPGWAGEYCGDDRLLVAPKAGFLFERLSDIGPFDQNFGDVAVADGRLHLSFTFDNCREGLRGFPAELIPVRWGERQYLLPADDLMRFCNAINSGAEPRQATWGRCLLRRGDEALSVSGWPDLPAEGRDALLRQPVQATVVEVGPMTSRPSRGNFFFHDTPLRLDAGRAEGLRVGMGLFVIDPESVSENVRIVSVDEHRAVGILTRDWDPILFRPQAGWRVSTRPSWRPSESAPLAK